MARESSLWQRMRDAGKVLRKQCCGVHLRRLENSVGTGDPDVGGCIDGVTFDIELKACPRPAHLSTRIRPKVKPSQSIWHRRRTEAGCKSHWVLIQVGDGAQARLYLIPGSRYDEIVAPEDDLELMSETPSTASMIDVLLRARKGW